MTATVRRVMIVGGGIAGMSMAILLRRAGITVDLIERDPEWRVYGAGITISGPTLRAFARVGILEDIRTQGFISPPGRLFTVDGTSIGDLPSPPPRDDLPGAGGILRPVLHRILSDRVRTSGTTVRLGLSVSHLVQDADGIDVVFDDASRARYDLAIGADGIYSGLRRLLFPNAPPPTPTGQTAWRVLAPRPPHVDRAEVYLGGRAKVGLNPCSQDELYLFALVPTEDDEVRIPDDRLVERLREILAPFGGTAGQIRDGLTPANAIVRRALETLFIEPPWHVGRAVLIGDAVHATTPHLASGAGMAVEDAVVLSRLLENGGPIEATLVEFEALRIERCRTVVDNSIALGEIELGRADPAPYQALMGGTAILLAEGAWGG